MAKALHICYFPCGGYQTRVMKLLVYLKVFFLLGIFNTYKSTFKQNNGFPYTYCLVSAIINIYIYFPPL